MENIFLACFAFGALFTIASVALGLAGNGATHAVVGHGPAHVQPPVGHAHIGHGHVGHGGHVGHIDAPHATTSRSASLPLLNASSFVGALTWFGAAGYLLLRLGDWALPVVIIGALLAAGLGWYLVARFLGLVLAGERELDPEDFRLEGTVGSVTVGIPAGGTGEVMFSKAGTRRSEAARGIGGEAIPRGSEVVITEYVDGFATVQTWGEFLAARDSRAAAEKREA